MKIVADPNIPYVREAFAALGDITLIPGRQITAASVQAADVLLVRSITLVNAALLDGSRVKFIATATIGTDHVEERYLIQRGIGFASAAGSNANSVAEYIVAALLELGDRHKFRLRDKTLGVIGVGNVGTKVVRYARALGMRVLENDPPRGLHEPALTADIVTVHVPLLETTRHLLHHDNLERFILLNTARGPVVDNRALLKAIDGDRIPAAVLDVWESEPNLSPELLDVVDIGTPHIAGYSFDGKVAGTRMIYEAACRHFNMPATWQPQLPAPAVPVIEMSVSSGDDEEDVLRRVIKRVYNITADDARLRANVPDFDKQRAEYPVRREFFNTMLTLRGASASLREKFAALGFQLSA
ncbi:MAG: 4-phosphoerythronate dehydrogenase [Verrucomicrobiota bacterium]